MKTVKLEDDLAKRVKLAATEKGETIQAFVTRTLERELKRLNA